MKEHPPTNRFVTFLMVLYYTAAFWLLTLILENILFEPNQLGLYIFASIVGFLHVGFMSYFFLEYGYLDIIFRLRFMRELRKN